MRDDVIFYSLRSSRRTLEEWGLDAGCEGFRRSGFRFLYPGCPSAHMGYILCRVSSLRLLYGCMFYSIFV